MAAQELKPVYLITGNDRPKVELAVQRLRARFDPGAVERLVAAGKDGADGESTVAACNAGTLLGDGRLVLVSEVDGRRGDDGRLKGGWKAEDIAAVVEYLASPAPATVLCLVGEEVRRDSALAKACAKAGDVLAWDVPKRGLNAWVADRLRQRGVRAEPEACALLLQLVGDDKLALALEIDKLAMWADGEPVGEREVAQLVAASAETPVYELTDAWASRDRAGALRAMEELLDRSERPRRDTAARIAGALGSHLGRLRRMQGLAADGVRAKEAGAKLKMNPYYGEKVFRQAEGFSVEELRDATVRLAELDHALKGGSRLAQDLELQLALTDLAREPGR